MHGVGRIDDVNGHTRQIRHPVLVLSKDCYRPLIALKDAHWACFGSPPPGSHPLHRATSSYTSSLFFFTTFYDKIMVALPDSQSPTPVRVQFVTETIYEGPTATPSSVRQTHDTPVPIAAIVGGAAGGASIALLVVLLWTWWGRCLHHRQIKARKEMVRIEHSETSWTPLLNYESTARAACCAREHATQCRSIPRTQ